VLKKFGRAVLGPSGYPALPGSPSDPPLVYDRGCDVVCLAGSDLLEGADVPLGDVVLAFLSLLSFTWLLLVLVNPVRRASGAES